MSSFDQPPTGAHDPGPSSDSGAPDAAAATPASLAWTIDRIAEDLLQAQKMQTIGALVSGVRHEFNNPLTAVRGYAELIWTDPGLPETTREDARRIREAGERAIALIQTFADFARERPPTAEAFAFGEIVAEVQALLRFDFMQPLRPRSSAGVAVSVRLPPDLPKVLADPGRIEQILLILLQNSLDAFRSRAARLPDPIGVVGHIDISGVAAADRLHCRIADDGPGVSPSMRGQLFEPFATSKPDGRGLGLWAAARLAAANDGSLVLEPTDRGAAFMLQLPLVVRPAGPRHVPAALPAAGPGSTSGLTIAERQQLPWVLVVDDEPSIRDVARRLLMRQGWNVALAADGDDALMQALSHPFDLVLMDHRMPGRSGAETWRALVGHDPSYRNRVILVSANEVEPELDALATDNSVVVLDKAATLKPATLAPQLQAHLEAVGRRATPGDHVEFAGSGGRPGPASARVPEEPLA